jgi:uracil-DNA glycosylase family 4
MIVGDMPYRDRNTSTIKQMSDGALRILIQAFTFAGIDLNQCYFTTVMHGVSPDGEPPTPKEVKACTEYLKEEIAKVKPKYVLLLGATALKGALGRAKLTEVHGSAILEDGITYLPTFHPALVLRDPTRFDSFVDDVKKFSVAVTGKTGAFKPELNMYVVESWESFAVMIKDMEDSREMSFDLETSDLNPYKPNVWVNCLTVTTPNAQWIVPLEHKESKWKGNRHDQLVILQTIKDVMKGHKIVGHNAKFDNKWLMRCYGLRFPLTFDTMIATKLCDENLPHISLKYLARRFFNAPEYDIKETEKMGECDAKTLYTYCATDGYYTLKLYYLLREELERNPGLKKVFINISMPLSNALEQVEANGVYVNMEKFAEVEKELLAKREALQAELDAYAKINWRSRDQVANLFYNQFGLQILERTDTGKPSTAEGVLKRLENQHPAVKKLLEYREVTKTISAFIEGWKEFIDENGRMHPNFNITGTVTGRLSCNEPNLQQVPKDGKIRNLITAPEGWTFVEADLSQIELRVAAMLAMEPTMLRIYNEGKIDLHTYTAAILTGKPTDKVEKKDRSNAKPVNFGLLYGMQAPTLKEYAFTNYGQDITLEQATEFRHKFFATYRGLPIWHEKQKQEARLNGGITTLTGRIRHLPAISSRDKKVVAEAERQAINSPVQSFSSDMCVSALIELANTLDPAECRIVGNVHDAILFEVRNDKVEELSAYIHKVMCAPKIIVEKFGIEFPLPIEAEVKVSPNGWGS